MGGGDDRDGTTSAQGCALVMPSGVAAAQARVAAIEQRFVTPGRAAPTASTAPVADFEALLATARLEGIGAPTASRALHLEEAHDHVRADGPTAPGPAGAPPELAAHGNGRIPATALAPIGQGQHRLWAPAADAFARMAEAAAREGVTIRVTDSYRGYDAQVDLARRKGLYSQGGLAARPGTSNHGWGRSLDIDTGAGTAEWLRANATRFGFHEDVPGEPWHWTYRPA